MRYQEQVALNAGAKHPCMRFLAVAVISLTARLYLLSYSCKVSDHRSDFLIAITGLMYI